jgi:hypothetical protein
MSCSLIKGFGSAIIPAPVGAGAFQLPWRYLHSLHRRFRFLGQTLRETTQWRCRLVVFVFAHFYGLNPELVRFTLMDPQQGDRRIGPFEQQRNRLVGWVMRYRSLRCSGRMKPSGTPEVSSGCTWRPVCSAQKNCSSLPALFMATDNGPICFSRHAPSFTDTVPHHRSSIGGDLLLPLSATAAPGYCRPSCRKWPFCAGRCAGSTRNVFIAGVTPLPGIAWASGDGTAGFAG